MSSAQSPSSIEVTVPVARLLTMSAGAAALWALLGLSRGATLAEYVALFAGAAVTLLMTQMTLDSARASGAFVTRVLAVCGLAGPPVAFAAYWLVLNTNHRALGAVTLVALALAAGLGASAFLSPLKVPWKMAVALWVAVVLGLAWPLFSGLVGFLVLADLGLGIALTGMIAIASRRGSIVLDSKLGGGIALALVLGSWVFALTAEAGAAAAVKAPVVAGIVGLLV